MANKPELNWNGDSLIKQIEEAAMEGLAVWGEVVLTESKKRVPQQTGTLMRSGAVTFEEPNEDSLYSQAKSADVKPQLGNPENKEMYLSFNTPYAYNIHEDLGLQHPNGGSAKFLESAINDHKKDSEKIVGAEILKRLK